MALVQVGDNDVLEVPDDWGAEQVNAHMREVRPSLFRATHGGINDIIRLSDAGVSERYILDHITSNPNSYPDTRSLPGLLDEAGVSGRVLDAILERNKSQPTGSHVSADDLIRNWDLGNIGPKAERRLNLASDRGDAAREGNILEQYRARMESLGDAGVLERAGEMLARGGANIVSSASNMALAPIESLAQLLPDYAIGIRKLAAASSLGRLVDAGQAAKGVSENIPSRAPTFAEARTLSANADNFWGKVSPWVEFMANAAAENAPQLLGGSVIGKLLGGAALPPKMMASAPGFFFRNPAPLSAVARSAIGSAATVLPQEFGGMYESLREKGVSPAQATGIASLFAVPSTALETVSDIPVLSRILGEGSRSYAKVLPRALMQSQLEGATEAAQEAMAIDAETAAGRVPSQPEQIERYLGAYLGGTAGGFGTSAATDAVGRFQYGASAGEPEGPQRILEPGPAVVADPLAPTLVDASPETTSQPAHRFAKVAKKLGIPLSQIEFVDAPITEEEAKSVGLSGPVQSYVTPDNRIRVFAPEITSDSELREILREEHGHIKLRTPEGQLAFQKFNSENTLTPEELAGLSAYRQAEGETDVAYKARLNDEFLAKLERDSWWRKLTDRFVTFGKQALGLKLNNRQAGRLLLRNIGKTGLTAATKASAVETVRPAPASLPNWVREEMVRRGIDPKRPLNDVDIGNTSVREAVELDPTLTREQKDSLLKHGQTKPPVPASMTAKNSEDLSTIDKLQRRLDAAPDGSGDSESLLSQINEIRDRIRARIEPHKSSYTNPLNPLEYGTISEIPESLFNGHDLTLFKALKSYGSNPRIVADDVFDDDPTGDKLLKAPIAAVYDAISDAIFLSGSRSGGWSNYYQRHVILHELTHAATWKAIRIPSNKSKVERLSELMGEVGSRWDEIRETYAGNHNLINHALENVDEFIAAGLSSYEFQRFLDSIHTTSRSRIGETKKFSGSLLKRFFESIANLLGFRDGTVLSEVLTISSDLIEGKSEGISETSRQTVAPASIVKPPSKRDILKTIRLSKSVQDQFPGVVLKFNEPNPNGDGRPISAGKDGAIYISPTKVEDPSKVRQQVMAEMARSGVSMFRDEDRDRLFTLLQKTQPDQVRQTAKRLGVDIADGEGRMKVLAEALSSQMQGWKRAGPLARKFVRGLRLAINRNAPETDGDQLLRALQTSVDTFRSNEPVRFEPENPDQVYADDHEPVWGLRTVIRSLRDRASELGYRQRDRAEWKQLDRDVQAMADAGRSRQIGGAVAVDDEGGILAINPEAENFLDVLEQLGVQITQRMREQHVMYRTELEARQVSNMLYRLEALESTKGNLAGMVSFLKFTTYDPAQIEQEIKELQAAISKKTGERTDDLDGGEIEARANEITDSDRSLPRARAAKMVLEHPEVRRLTEILDRISESGLTPRPAAQLSDFHASRAEVVHDMLRAAYRGLQDAALREQAKFLRGQYASGVTGFKRRLTATLSKQGELEVAMSDIVRQLGRELGLSGSLRSPEAERVLRDEAAAISRLAIALAQADPDTPAGRLRENILMSPGSLLVPAQDLRVVAGQAGVSEEALSRVLKYIRDLPDLQHAVPQLFEASMSAAQNATITVLQKIEDALEDGTEEGDKKAKHVAENALDRLRRTWERLARREVNQREHLEKLEQERLYHEAFVEFTAQQMPDLQGVRRMTYQTEDGWKFVGFKLPEGGEQAEINIRVGQEYTQATLRQIIDWQANAMRAISAHSVDEQTRRGLSVGALMANEFLDQNFTHAQFTSALAPGSLMRLIDRTPLRTKENMAAYVPGLFGDRIRKTGKTWEDVGAQGDRLKARHVKTFHRLFWSAARSLGLNPNNPGDSQRMADAYNEVSHRLRQTNSGVADGDQLLYRSVRGRTVTRELLNLIRYTRRIGRDGQSLVKSSWYGGVRVDLPGRQVVRPPAETGDLGLGRLPDQQKAWDLAKRYRDSQGNDLAPELEQFWDSDSDAVLSAMDDMDRSDFVLSADPLLKQLAGLAIRRIRMNDDPIPGTVQEWAERLASFMPGIGERFYGESDADYKARLMRKSVVAEPSGDLEAVLKERMMHHLAQYGRVASTKHPDGSERPLRSTGVSVGESEVSEFTKPASPVVYPGSWYNYGSSKGLGDFIGRMSDVSQVEYLNALKSASAHLKERARLVRASIESGEIQKFAPDILFHTQGAWLSLMGKKLTPKRAESAARAMVQAANIMSSEIAQIDRFGTPSISFVVNFIRSAVAWLLAGPSAAVTNVVGGPMASHPINVAMFGTGLGVLLTASQFAASSAHWLVDTIASIGRGVIPVELQPDLLAAHETHDFLEAHGIGTSYDRGDLAELEKFADGESGRSNTAKVFDASQQAASSTSEVIGVRLGDRILNRYAVRFVVPLYLFRLRQMAYAYVERLNKLGLRPDNTEATSFGQKDSANHAYARELLGEIGNVDDLMWRLGNDEVDPRRFYRSEIGRKLGASIMFKFNASSRLNRPNSNGWLQLVGWSSHMLSMLALSFRTTADTPVYKKVGQMLARTSATALALSLAYWIPLAARQGILGVASDSMRRISEILSGEEPPEDEQGMADWANRMFAKLCAVLHNIPGIDQLLNLASATTRAASRALIPGAKVLPWQSSFIDRPASEIAKDLALSVPAGIGITLDGYRLPVIDLAYQGASAATQVGRGVLGYLSAHDAPGQEEAGKVDMVAGMKQALSLYGIAGRTLGELILPATTEDRVGRRAILSAAAEAGVQAAAPFQTQGFASPTPIRRTLMDAGRKMLAGDAQAEQTVLNMAQFVYDRAKNKAVNQGDDIEAAEKAGLSAVKNALRTLNPYEAALGRSITEGQFDALKSKLGKNAAVERDERAAEAVINSVASKYGFEVTTGMLTPTKKPPGSGRPRGGGRSRYGRRSLGGRRYGRRSIGRSRRIS